MCQVLTMLYQDQGQKKMTSFQLSGSFVLLTLISQAVAFAQGPVTWGREAADDSIRIGEEDCGKWRKAENAGARVLPR